MVGAMSAAAIVTAPGAAGAEGLFDFLFGGFARQHTVPPPVSAYAEPGQPPLPAAPARREHLTGGGGGRFVAFCVRLCDGQHFPIDRNANATPVESCRAMCPTAKTKIFFGSEIDRAVAHDGARYADLDHAYAYRDHLVPNCTCNGKDAFGLTAIEPSIDPTLRPGDVVVTAKGLMAYAGKPDGHTASFTPVDAATLAAATSIPASHMRLSERSVDTLIADEEPGIVAPPPQAGGHPRGQADR